MRLTEGFVPTYFIPTAWQSFVSFQVLWSDQLKGLGTSRGSLMLPQMMELVGQV